MAGTGEKKNYKTDLHLNQNNKINWVHSQKSLSHLMKVIASNLCCTLHS